MSCIMWMLIIFVIRYQYCWLATRSSSDIINQIHTTVLCILFPRTLPFHKDHPALVSDSSHRIPENCCGLLTFIYLLALLMKTISTQKKNISLVLMGPSPRTNTIPYLFIGSNHQKFPLFCFYYFIDGDWKTNNDWVRSHLIKCLEPIKNM